MEGGAIFASTMVKIMSDNTQMIREKRWILKSADAPGLSRGADAIANALQIHPIVAKLLFSRGYKSPAEAKAFLAMESEMLCNPFDLKDMREAVRRVLSAISRRERITIYGDYDVDGVTSVCTLYLYLKSLGAVVDYYIPNRATDGYGVTRATLESLAAKGTSLIVTVDTGITAIEEVKYARSLGMEFVITDHHECRAELPPAIAVVNPHRPDCSYPFKELAGVGVVFKFICAIEETQSAKSRIAVAQKMFSLYSDLVAIGTIADVMPIHGENRIIVSYGLHMIESTKRPGLLALMDAASSRPDERKGDARKRKVAKISSGYIGYTLAPRINAAGRIKSATRAVELFLSPSYSDAYCIAEELCAANKERQNEENKIIEDAFRIIDKQIDLNKDSVIVLSADNWHHGVIGIVASRITERFCCPSILVSFEGGEKTESGSDIGKGSGRSIKGMNLVDALCYCSDILVKFGGHELAAGLSVTRENLPKFREKINEYARKNLSAEDMVPTVEADLEVSFDEVNMSLAESLRTLEPYGVGNPVPTFAMYGVTISDITPVSEGKHTRLTITKDGKDMTAMFFSTSPKSLGVFVGDSADLIFNLDVNDWMGRRSVQLIVKDIRTSENQTVKNDGEKDRFARIWAGEPFSSAEDILPDRNDFAAVYRLILASSRAGINTLSHREICAKASSVSEQRKIGYIKLKIIIKVLTELNVIGIEERDEVYTFRLYYNSGKADLEKSSLLRRLRAQQKSGTASDR